MHVECFPGIKYNVSQHLRPHISGLFIHEKAIYLLVIFGLELQPCVSRFFASIFFESRIYNQRKLPAMHRCRITGLLDPITAILLAQTGEIESVKRSFLKFRPFFI